MTYTINGKQYTEFDINKRCSELLSIEWFIHPNHEKWNKTNSWIYSDNYNGGEILKDFCNNPFNTWTIIEKCWDELMCTVTDWDDVNIPKWERVIDKHNCTKLVAACICLIESKEGV
jgi:hypothetical protein